MWTSVVRLIEVQYLTSGLELNRQLGAYSKKKTRNRTSGIVIRILKAPAASAGPADFRIGLKFLITSPESNCLEGSTIFESPPQPSPQLVV